MAAVYRTISPQPYNFTVEMYFDANRNTTRVDTEDQQPAYDSADPSSACYAQFSPSGSGGTAHVPMQPGPGGSVRPGWFTNLYQFNLLDNNVEEDIDATGSTPANLITSFLHDPNQNLIQITKPAGNIVEFDFDERDMQIATRIGMDPATGEPGSITITPLDANGNALMSIGPANRGGTTATVVIADAFRSGTTLTHTGDLTISNVFDGFNRVIAATDPLRNVNYTHYDPNGRTVSEMTNGSDGFSGDGLLASTQMRLDEAGREYERQRQAFVIQGVGVSADLTVTHNYGGLAANSVVPRSGSYEMVHFGNGQGENDLSYVLARTVYDRASRPAAVLQDNTAQSTTTFDGANRPIEAVDALGNTVQNTFDGNGNVILSTRTEICTITTPAVANEVFQSAMLYDSLNKLVVRAQQGADGKLDLNLLNCGSDAIWQVASGTIIDRFGYDSRGNECLIIDPKGNTTVAEFDGAKRPIGTQQHLRTAGQGSNPPVANQSNSSLAPSPSSLTPSGSLLPGASACIVTTNILDGNGRLTQLIDDRGDMTLFQFDTLDRQTITTFHDGSTRENVYDEAGDVTKYTDENGSVFSNTFDALGRKTNVAIAPASGIGGTTTQSFLFDGLSRMSQAVDSVGGTFATVNLIHDSLDRTVAESQAYGGNTRIVASSAFTSYPVTGFVFPQGRQLTYTCDALYRRTLVDDVTNSVSVAAWQFFGRDRVAEVTLGNGLICTWMNNARTNSAVQSTVANPAWGDQSSDRLGYDGAGRPITKRYLAGGINGTSHAYNTPSSVVGFTTEYDLASNKFYERPLHAEERGHLYEPFTNGSPTGGYDSLNRLRQYQRGALSGTGGFGGNGGGSIATPIALPNTDTQRTYDLDSLGNWRRTVFTPEGGSQQTEIRQHNALNEITRIQNGATQANLLYDGIAGASNGNLANDGTREFFWDALNRLLEVKRVSDGAVIGQYAYDALNRRIRKTISGGGLSGTIPNGTTDCIYLGWRCVEERNPFGEFSADIPTIQYVWGIYLDELLQQYAYVDFGSQPLSSGAYYPLQDLLYRTTALTNSSGAIVEAYDTDAYGNTLIFNAPGTDDNWWADDAAAAHYPACSFIFTGQRFDPETESYYYKERYYVAQWGRFSSRDPVGTVRLVALYHYADDAATVKSDPEGLIPAGAGRPGPGKRGGGRPAPPVNCQAEFKQCNKDADDAHDDCDTRAIWVCTVFCAIECKGLGPAGKVGAGGACEAACLLIYDAACDFDWRNAQSCCHLKLADCNKNGAWPGFWWALRNC